MGSFSAWHWVIFGLIVWIVFAASKSGARQRAKRHSSDFVLQQPASQNAYFEWPQLGEYEFEVVGESRAQAELSAMAGEHGNNSAEVYKIALLIPEDNNPHDNKAVRIEIDGYAVGHLSRDNARSFRRRLSAKGLSNKITRCGAVIMGGFTNRSGEKMHYGVRLDIKPFE